MNKHIPIEKAIGGLAIMINFNTVYGVTCTGGYED